MRGPQKAQPFVGPLDGRVRRLGKRMAVAPTRGPDAKPHCFLDESRRFFVGAAPKSPKPLSGCGLPKTGILNTETTTPLMETAMQQNPSNSPCIESSPSKRMPTMPAPIDAISTTSLSSERIGMIGMVATTLSLLPQVAIAGIRDKYLRRVCFDAESRFKTPNVRHERRARAGRAKRTMKNQRSAASPCTSARWKG